METSIDLKYLDSFVRVASAGSLSKASQRFDIPKATLSNHLRRLEDNLGVELFVRKPRSMEVTVEGKELLRHCQDIFAVCEKAAYSIKNVEETLSGVLRIASGTEFGTSVVGPLLCQFSSEHPQLAVEIDMLSSELLFSEELDVDCSIYVGTPPDSRLIGKKLGDFTFGVYGNPNYLARQGRPRSIRDLKRHNAILYRKSGAIEQWKLQRSEEFSDFTPSSRVLINDYWMVKYFAVAGMGLAYLPNFFVQNELKLNALQPVLKSWQSDAVPIYALFPKQRYKNRKVQKFVAYWIERFDELNQNPPYALMS
jgi:DNA-binding transcriptional LysR family regulator